MKPLCMVQARMRSSRLPGKVMLPLAGAPLLARMLERLESAAYDVVVATTTLAEDDAIAALARRLGVRSFRGHPTDLVDRHLRAAQSFGAEMVLRIPADCPLIDPVVVERVLECFAQGGYDYVSNLHPASYPEGYDVEVMPRALLELAAQEGAQDPKRFVWQRSERFRIGNVRWDARRDLSMSHRFTVDYADDYHFVAAVYAELWSFARTFSLEEILQLLDERPDIFALNVHYAGGNWYSHHLSCTATMEGSHGD